MKRLHILLTALLVLTTDAVQANEALRTAARIGDTEQVRALLEAGADPNAERRSYSPLMFAAGNGHVEMTRLLLARGAAVDHRDHNGDRALLWAAERGHVETVRMLLAAGAAVQSDDDPYQRTPLMRAAGYARVEVVRVLLAAGADARRRDHTDDTALHQAATSGNPEIITMLLAAGGDPDIGDRILRRRPIHLAATYGRIEAVRLLAATGAALNARDHEGRTALWTAASRGHAAVVELLLVAGADDDARDDKDVSPFLAALEKGESIAWLMVELTRDIDRGFAAAIWSGYADLARRLAERGADVNALDQYARPAVAGAARHRGTDMLAWFIANGVDLGRHGTAALHHAAASGRTDLVGLLLDSNVPVDARDDAGATALLRAVGRGQVEVVALLLARGAERNPRDWNGRDAEAYMSVAAVPIADLIKRRGMSRAYKPTAHLEMQLADLTAQHAAIRELLAQ
jgi:ankyrin repeat protein